MNHEVERAFYRIVFPERERPILLLEGREHPVVDCSEHGLRFERRPWPPLELGAVVHGILRFHKGDEIEVEGEVVRLQDEHAAVHLNVRPIPMGRIFEEQRYLRMLYPMRRP